jgi:asparagine synthase (glutamine-hydrolysing)
MCGILALFHEHRSGNRFEKLNRRGPDMSGHFATESVWLGHTRLAIVGPEAGAQPIITANWVLVINGEIYNGSGPTDCYCVPELLDSLGPNAPVKMDGVFSFVAYNKHSKDIIVARDAVGVTPLYWGTSPHGLYFASLLDAIPVDALVKVVPPGHSTCFNLSSGMPEFKPWSTPYNPWVDLTLLKPPTNLVELMYNAVSKRLMGDVPWGVLLSGGLDSTIIASIAVQLSHKRRDYPIVHTFCIGIKDSPDVHWAKIVAEELGTYHTSFEYTIEEGIAAIPEVVRAVESYDVTTIRASTPMWLMGKALKRRGIKMVLSGEGSDELFAGYLYNLFCPSESEMVKECQKKMYQLHAFDCARANKTLGDWGVETRVPFLDREVVDFAMNRLHPRYKMSGTHPDGPKAEKWFLRAEFQHLVPKCVIDRTKAQFSDAVGSDWITQLKKVAAEKCDSVQVSVDNEAKWYKSLFDKQFPQVGAEKTVLYTKSSIACSSAVASHWHAGFQHCLDPSGDAVATAMSERARDFS